MWKIPLKATRKLFKTDCFWKDIFTNFVKITLFLIEQPKKTLIFNIIDGLFQQNQLIVENSIVLILGLYEYSYEEVPTECFDLERSKNPDVRYYACVVDKNRAGAKPKVVFRLNLAYNEWEELGYLRLKTKN